MQNPLDTAKKAKRPAVDCSTPGVNLCVGLVRRKPTSAPGRTRTYDPAVNSRLLYQLSYRSVGIAMFSLLPANALYPNNNTCCLVKRRRKTNLKFGFCEQ